MRLIEAMREKGNPYWIPDCSRRELPQLFVELGFRTGVEIGVRFAENLVDYCKVGLEMYGIDPWTEMEDAYQYALKQTEPYPNCHLIRKTSMDAVADFPNRSINFIYIDGSHDFGDIAMDIWKWSGKVKKGGVIAGHDFLNVKKPRELRFVRPIVEAYAQAFDYANWYVIGKPGEGKHDKELSFMFFKHW